MADHRVDDLRLRLIGTSSQPEKARRAAEMFVSAVLEEVGDRLASSLNGSIVFLPSLPLRWSMDEAELADAAAISLYADQIASSIGEPALHRVGSRVPEQGAVRFRDEAHWWAAYLAACATPGGDAWARPYEALRTKGIGFGSLASRGRDFAIAALLDLAEANALRSVVGGAGREQVEQVCQCLGVPGEIFRPGLITNPSLRIEVLELSRRVRTFAGPDESATALLLYTEALSLMGASAPAADVEEVVRAAAIELRESGGTMATDSARARDTLQTNFGGMFYLLSLALEMELGEALWKACLPEGAFLAHCAASLLGPAAAGDTAALLFGGVSKLDLTATEVVPEQQEELAAALLAAFAAAVPRRTNMPLPTVALALAPSAGGPALIAAERGSPFLIFDWPAHDAASVEKGLRAFFGAWPASAPPVLGTPAIAEVEGRVRVRATTGLKLAPGMFLPGDGSPWGAALVAQTVGALCQLFVLRAGSAVASAAQLVERYLTIPATIQLTSTEMNIRLPGGRVDIGLRRAGLDRDPGWVPWLGRSVRFIFEVETE